MKLNLAPTLATLALASMIATVGHAFNAERNPVGEQAKYILDNNGNRTTSMIRSGSATAVVTARLPDAKAYNVKVAYDMMIDFVGRKSGEKDCATPECFFKSSLMEELRQKKTMQLPFFKLTHQGYADIRNKDGKTYSNTDKILISDIKHAPESDLYGLLEMSFMQAMAVTGATQAEIQDLKILVHYTTAVPVLGAAKIDMSGKASGHAFKAGFDNQSN